MDWEVGSEIVIAPSGYNFYEDERRFIVEKIDDYTLRLDRPLDHSHFGEIADESGIAVDYRAEVGILTRNIVIQGDESSDYSLYGAHMMVSSCFLLVLLNPVYSSFSCIRSLLVAVLALCLTTSLLAWTVCKSAVPVKPLASVATRSTGTCLVRF